MNLHSITLRIISAPLKRPFITHLEKVETRQVIIIEAMDQDGRTGFGEAVPFSSPWYTEETLKTCLHMMKDFLVPMVLKSSLSDPSELQNLWKGIRRNSMAKSGIEQALWDLYAKQQNVYIGNLFGGTRKAIESGAVIAAGDEAEALEQIEELLEEDYKRYKIKINRDNDLSILKAVRSRYPSIPLMADANSAYTLADSDHLKRLDEFNLMMIEQPLGETDLVEHASLQQQLTTPICLDESISSYDDARTALALGSCQIITIKMGRAGGWSNACAIHDICRQKGIPVWCGGMIEFGISRAHNIALATLPGFTIPGDISSSSKYWDEDIIEPEVSVSNGSILVPDGPGIGFAVNFERLNALTEAVYMFT